MTDNTHWRPRTARCAIRLCHRAGATLLTLLALALTLATTPLAALADHPARATAPPAFSALADGKPPAPWRFASLPNKTPTEFSITALQGQQVLRVATHDSYGNLIYPLRVPASPAMSLRWRWRVDQLVTKADIRQRSGDDAALKLCISFDYDKSLLSWSERTKLRLAAVNTGEAIPAQTLCYLWDNKQPTGSVLNNAFTSRMRYIVLQSGSEHLGQWMSEQRDLAADYQRAFGDESPQHIPDLLALIVSADADNTHGTGLAYLGDIQLGKSQAAAAP